MRLKSWGPFVPVGTRVHVLGSRLHCMAIPGSGVPRRDCVVENVAGPGCAGRRTLALDRLFVNRSRKREAGRVVRRTGHSTGPGRLVWRGVRFGYGHPVLGGRHLLVLLPAGAAPRARRRSWRMVSDSCRVRSVTVSHVYSAVTSRLPASPMRRRNSGSAASLTMARAMASTDVPSTRRGSTPTPRDGGCRRYGTT
jgi:hypothetical protein